MTDYSDSLERFRKDTDEHVMRVLLDDGVYRHVFFQKPGTGFYWYELITTPGQLTFRGDMGCYVFSRLHDMFTFFTGGTINPGYWGEKLIAHSGYREYSEDRARQIVTEHFKDHHVHVRDPQAVWQAITDEILAEDIIPFEDLMKIELMNFRHPSGYEFVDAWEWDLRDFTVQFLWCCHAVQQGIRQYVEVNGGEL